MLTNSYICYKKFHSITNSKNVLSNYKFFKQTSLDWIEQDQYWHKAQVKAKEIKSGITGEFHIIIKRKKGSDVSTVSGISCADASSSGTNQKKINQKQNFTSFYPTIEMSIKHIDTTFSKNPKGKMRNVSITYMGNS